ncbi:hypothetical protein EBU94_03790, partial [bacterium]|nr:hypothetical protein [bacterium]
MEKIYTYEEFLHEKMLFPLKPTSDTKLESEKEVENFLEEMVDVVEISHSSASVAQTQPECDSWLTKFRR